MLASCVKSASALLCFILYNIGLIELCSWTTVIIMILANIAEIVLPINNQETLETLTSNNSNSGRGKGKKTIRYRSSRLKCVLLLVSSMILFQILFVLFGAPVRGAVQESALFSCLLCVLVVVPGCLKAGIHGPLSLFSANPVNIPGNSDILRKSAFLTLFGAWCGGVVIPLDWDRPWQRWPLPCFTGALLAFMFCHLFLVLKSLPPFQRKGSAVKEGEAF